MPSPFPEMDPYLENPYTFSDFQHEMISSIRAELNRALRPKYVVRIEERVYISDECDPENRVIDYEKPPKPPLPPNWDKWALPFRRAGATR